MGAVADKIDELLEQVEVEGWLEREGIEFRRTTGSHGPQANVKTCPKCGGSNWKVYLGLESGLGNCFHGDCGATFNKWSFVKAHLGDPATRVVIEHLEQVARDVGWRPKRRITAAVVENQVKLPVSHPLPFPGGENLVYLESRGIEGDLARYFHLRYCEEGWWNFDRPDGRRGGQNFAQRVIIPVYDLDGELVTFQGRDLTGAAEQKYLFPSGLPGTGRFLWNGQNAALARAKRVVMNEGAFDVMATKIALDQEVALRDVVPVGSFGKHLSAGDTEEGNDQLGRFIKLKALGLEEVTIMWDGERQALLDALRAGERLTGLGLRTKLALLPRDKDPNEVDGRVVREAFWKAELWTPRLAVQWRLINPYR